VPRRTSRPNTKIVRTDGKKYHDLNSPHRLLLRLSIQGTDGHDMLQVYGKIELHTIFWSKELETGVSSDGVGLLLMIILRIEKNREEENGLRSTDLEQVVTIDGVYKHDHGIRILYKQYIS
jgi:hypothetical protein